MSVNLKSCIDVLKMVASVKNAKLRKKVLTDLSNNDCIYKAIKEIVRNTLNKNIKLKISQRRKLKKYTKLMKNFNKKNKSKLSKKRLVIQSGGFLPLLIPAAVSIISEIIKNAT